MYATNLGSLGYTVIANLTLLEPAALEAVMVYSRTVDVRAGLPDRTPVDGSIDKPSGNAGSTE